MNENIQGEMQNAIAAFVDEATTIARRMAADTLNKMFNVKPVKMQSAEDAPKAAAEVAVTVQKQAKQVAKAIKKATKKAMKHATKKVAKASKKASKVEKKVKKEAKRDAKQAARTSSSQRSKRADAIILDAGATTTAPAPAAA